MRTCWIFALSSQCGIFTTMIVEGLQTVLEISCLSAIWISDDHNGLVSLQHKKTWDPSKAYLRVVWIAWQSRTAFTCFHRHVCLLAFFVLCLFWVCIGVHSDMAASTRMALFCSPCDEYFAEYFYWSRSAESLPPWSLRACELIWRCFGCLLNVVFRKWQERVFEFGKMLKTPRRAVFWNVWCVFPVRLHSDIAYSFSWSNY